jgi:copper resistance protein B
MRPASAPRGRLISLCAIAAALTLSAARPSAAQIKDNEIFTSTQMDLSYNLWDRGGSFRWEGEGWIGTDKNKFYWKTEGERLNGEMEEAELQLLYSRYISEFWDFQVGVRQDFVPRATTFAVIGLQGTAPYMIEVDVALFISDDGDVSARLELEYDILVTNKLVASPYLTLDFSANKVANRSLGTGLTEVETGLQVRYLITRDFAPFVDFRYSRLIGETANLAKAEGEDRGAFRILLGVRVRF